MISLTHIAFTAIRTAWFAKLPTAFFASGLILLFLASPLTTNAARQMENLGRGVVAVRSSSSQAFISWRLLALDPAGVGFNVYRSANGSAPVKLNGSTLTNGCNYSDTPNMAQTNAYHVRSVIGGVEQAASAAWTLKPNTAQEPLFRIPLQKPANRAVHNVWVGDLDGDGEYEFIACWVGTTVGQTQKIQTYKRDGTLLWEVDFGPNSVDSDNIYVSSATIAAGQWDGVTVYDLDGDGRAEVVVKSANGVTFGDGTTLTYADNLTQFISVLDGMTGAERARTLLPNPWKDSIGLPLGTLFGIGYADGIRPSLYIHAKNRNPSLSFNLIESAWDFRGGVLSNRWSIQWNGDSSVPQNSHQMRLVDVNGDGKDELIPGMHAISSSGTLLYDLGTQGIVHGDRFHISDLDPNRPGLEGYGIQQNNSSGMVEYFTDAATGQILWTVNIGATVDAGRGTASDVDPRYAGYECWSFYGMRTATGTGILTNSPVRPWPNLQMWWDADLLGENLDEEIVDKWNYTNQVVSRVLTAYSVSGGATANGRNVPMLYGDILGDWREELVYADYAHSNLVVFTTTSFTTNRLYTLAQNPAYRNCLTVKGYVQANLPDYYLGFGMSNPPAPNIVYVTNTLPPAAPNAPSGLTATAISDSQINLTWTDNAINEEGFQIERSTNGVNFQQVMLAAANMTNYSDVGLASATTFYYRIRASNLGGQSAYSSTASATTDATTLMVKSDTATMNTAVDWSGTTPTISEVGLFNNILSAVNAAALTLGGDVALRGLNFANNLNGPVSVAAGNALTLGSAGIDMSQANQGATFNNNIVLASNQVWNVVGGRTLAINGSFTSASNTVIKTGSGTLALGSTSNDAGARIQVNSGVVQANVSSGITIALNGGIFNVNVADNNPVNVMSGGTEQNVGGNRTWSGNLTGSGPLTVVASSIHTWSGNNTGYDGTITLQGSGTLRLSSVNSVSAGTAYSFNGGNMTANASGIFNLGSLAGTSGTIFGGAGQNYSIGALNADTDFGGVISGATMIIKTGTGTQSLSGANTYSSGTVVNNGELQVGNGGTNGTPGTGNVTNNAALAFNRSDAIDDAGFGVISGIGSLTKRGAGQLTLTKAHTYSGATTIEAGTLALTNGGAIANSSGINISADALFDVSLLSGGTMTLGSGKTLSGYGAVKGGFVVGSGARLLPGDSFGTLTFSNSLSLAAGSTNIFEVSQSPLTNDAAMVLGALTNGGTLIVTNVGAAPLESGASFKLFSAASHNGTFAGVILPPLNAGLRWDTNSLNTNGLISVVVVPSPSAPLISSVSLSGGNLIFGGTNGSVDATYYVLTATNITVPLANWTRIATNQVSATALFTFTNTISPGSAQGFYRLQVQ